MTYFLFFVNILCKYLLRYYINTCIKRINRGMNYKYKLHLKINNKRMTYWK